MRHFGSPHDKNSCLLRRFEVLRPIYGTTNSPFNHEPQPYAEGDGRKNNNSTSHVVVRPSTRPMVISSTIVGGPGVIISCLVTVLLHNPTSSGANLLKGHILWLDAFFGYMKTMTVARIHLLSGYIVYGAPKADEG